MHLFELHVTVSPLACLDLARFCCLCLRSRHCLPSLLLLQGLPATVTSLLSLTALRLRDRNVLIKRTDIIENLGVATIIASDKTGNS